MNLTLSERQKLFTKLVSLLILEMYARGYEVTCGDFWAKPRNPLEHKKNSLHYSRCAADLNLFKDGEFLKQSDDHKKFGAFWESLHPYCTWGGRWSDGNHYEVSEKPRPEVAA
jgi:hypothetical protein